MAVVSGLPPLHQAEDLVHEELSSTEFVRVCRPDYRPFPHVGAPRGVVQDEVESGKLAAIPIDHPFAKVKEGIIYRAGAIHPPALFALIDAIKAEQHAAGEGTGAVASVPPLRTPAPTPARRSRAARPRDVRALRRRPKP